MIIQNLKAKNIQIYINLILNYKANLKKTKNKCQKNQLE